MTYVVNDRIKLIDGADATIKFIGKTRLDNTIWFGIEYISSLTSPYKPTLITSADIKSHRKKSYKSYKSNKSISKSKKKLKSHNKTSSSILTTTANSYKKRIKSSRKRSNESIFQQKVKQSLAKKQKQKKKERSSSAPSKTIETHLIAMDTMDINNTFAINDNFDDILSTIDSPKDTVTNKNKNKIKKKKSRNKYHSDITANILSLSSLTKKTKKHVKNTQKQSSPSLIMNGTNMPSTNPIIGTSKSDETKAVSPSYSTNIDFAALIEDNNIILNEEKEIENDIRFKQQYSKIFTSIKSKQNGEKKKHQKLSNKSDGDGDDSRLLMKLKRIKDEKTSNINKDVFDGDNDLGVDDIMD